MHIRSNRWTVYLGLVTSLLGVAWGCSSDEEGPTDGAVGAACAPDQAGTCAADLLCTPHGDGYVCTYEPGASCNPELENGGCADTALCSGPADAGMGEARCLIKEGEQCDPLEPYCVGELTCAELVSGGYRCFGAVILQGQVSDSSDNSAIEAAQIIASDEEGVAISDVAESGADGSYSLEVPVARDDEGNPADAKITLRAAAQDYQPFPSGIRVALPIDASQAEAVDGQYVIDNALTDISLIPLADAERQSIRGTLAGISGVEGGASGEVGGVLVVATGPEGTFTGITDKSGNYTIFNVPDGDYTVKAYAADIQVGIEEVTVSGAAVADFTLTQVVQGTTVLSGNIQLVNAPGGAETSVVLVVAETFDTDAARGEVPRGLRAPRTGVPNVSGSFEIRGVPEGNYIVLAAYENDDLVRDPDTNIAGTDFVRVTVTADEPTLSLADSFKVTEALAVIGPGVDGPEAITEAPLLSWADDSSEDWYELRVFDAFGNDVWALENVPSASGSGNVSVQYEGPLVTGMYYQFRVRSWRQPGGGDAAPIATTEDLRGVFFKPAL